MREFMLLDMKYYCKSIIIKAIRHWYKCGQKTMICNPWLTLAQDSQKIQRRESNFLKNFLFGIIGYPQASQTKPRQNCLYLLPYAIINSDRCKYKT